MESLVFSFVAAFASAGNPGSDPKKVSIIIPRSRAYLADLLAKSFEGREDIEIIVDRRYAERRTQKRSVAEDRSRMQRRRSKEEVIEVVVGRTSPPEGLGGEPA